MVINRIGHFQPSLSDGLHTIFWRLLSRKRLGREPIQGPSFFDEPSTVSLIACSSSCLVSIVGLLYMRKLDLSSCPNNIYQSSVPPNRKAFWNWLTNRSCPEGLSNKPLHRSYRKVKCLHRLTSRENPSSLSRSRRSTPVSFIGAAKECSP